MKKRTMAILLSLCMVLSLLPGTARAEGEAEGAGNVENRVETPEAAVASDGTANTDFAVNPNPTGSAVNPASTGETDDMSGNCGGEGDGSNVKWTLDSAGCLTIRGTGKMGDWYDGLIERKKLAPWYQKKDLITSVKIEIGVTSIGAWAFYGYSNLTDISLPAGITTIGEFAFDSCSSLTSINFPAEITTIGDYAFYGCSSLTGISLPDGITKIGNYVFSGCSSLSSVNLPAGLTDIRLHAFAECSSLANISLPAGLKFIDGGAFARCSSLISMSIPAGVNSIGDAAFQGCINLTSINIPEGVLDIGNSTFAGCSSLTSINIPDSVIVFCSYPFAGCDSLADVYYAGTRSQWCDIRIDFLDRIEGLKKARIHCIDDPVITYDANGGSGSMDSATLTMIDWYSSPDDYTAEEYSFPKCSFTAPAGKAFKAWSIDGKEYAPGTAYEPVGKVTVKAVWDGPGVTPPAPEKPAITGFTLTGTITGHKDVAYTSVTAALVGLDGTRYVGTVEGGDALDGVTKKECAYSVTAPAGQYSLEVEAVTTEGVTVNRTAVVKLKGEGQTKNVNLPNGLAKSKVAVGKSGAKVLVGGLDDLMMDREGTLADGAKAVEVTFAVDEVKETAPEAVALKDAAPGQTLEFYDFTIMKTVDGAGKKVSDTGAATVEIVLPFDKSGKGNVKVYRYHEGSVDILTEAEAGGERIAVDGESITIYAKKFSVYAVGYAPAGSVEEPGTTTPPGGPENPKSPDTGDDSMITLWIIAAPCALAATFAARRRRRATGNHE